MELYCHRGWMLTMDTEEGSVLKRINVDEKGEFDDWPLGVFSESFELTKEINRYVNDSAC